MLCVDEPQYLSKALGHDNSSGTGLNTLEEKKEMLRYFHKSWSGLVKYIQTQCKEKGKCVDFPLVGRFIRQDVYLSSTMKDTANAVGTDKSSTENDKYCFIPHLDFLSSGKFSFPQNDYNISPLSRRVPKGQPTVKVSLGAIGQRAEYDRELVASILKDTISKLVSFNFVYVSIKFLFNRLNKIEKGRKSF